MNAPAKPFEVGQLAAEQPFGLSLPARYAGRTVLAIGAHPDDVELGMGGTLARLARSGAQVVMAVVSVPSDYATRRREAARAAQILGAELRVLLDAGCQRIEEVKSYQLVGLLDNLVRTFRPDAVFTHGTSEFHRDHQIVHAAVSSTQRLRYFDFFAFHPTMCRPVPVPFHPRVYVDITPTIEAKMEAIAAHESQFGARGLDVEMYKDIARMHGRLVGVQYAEGLDVARLLLA
ncbi:MAG TPA: PIG-L family deacetylase [Burkholderiales bacterium]|nr:PIG-L family deacetylase [Burkholderiales bacterium]